MWHWYVEYHQRMNYLCLPFEEFKMDLFMKEESKDKEKKDYLFAITGQLKFRKCDIAKQ